MLKKYIMRDKNIQRDFKKSLICPQGILNQKKRIIENALSVSVWRAKNNV